LYNLNIRISSLSRDNKRLLKNFVSLFSLQATNFILPILLFPYLIRVLGIEKFGMVSLAQAFTTYLMVFTDYGFNLSATRDIAINKADSSKLKTILDAVFTTKAILSFIGFAVMIIVVGLIPKFRDEWWLFLLSFPMVIGYVIQPVWFFQGMEQMTYIAYLNLLTKLLFTGLVFVFIRSPSDYIYANLFQGIGSILSGLITLWVVYRKFGLTIGIARWNQVKHQLSEGWHIFLSNFSIHAYVYSNLFILSLFTNSTVVGYYSIAEKVIFAVRQVLSVFSQAIYPYICSLSLQAHSKIRSFFISIYLPFALFIFCICALLYLFSGQVVIFLAGHPIASVSGLIKLLSFIPFIVTLNIPAYQTLLAYNFKQSYSAVLITGSILNIVLNIFLSYTFAASGTAMAVIITELFITIGLYIILEIKHSRYSLFIHSSQTL
jgi:PST family polysaccharide transporter